MRRVLARTNSGVPPGKHSRSESSAEAWESFALIAMYACAGFVAALSSMGRGPFPARQRLAAILPGLQIVLAGELPSLREGDRNLFSVRAWPRGVCLAGLALFSSRN